MCVCAWCPPGSQDRSLRRWQRSNEPFFVEEEKEKRLESLFEADLQQEAGREEAANKDKVDQQVGGGWKEGSTGAAKPWHSGSSCWLLEGNGYVETWGE
jgi:hypothetical protein